MIVKLEGLEFFANHGVYSEEQIVGNKYTVDVELSLDSLLDFTVDDLNKTVDYEEVYVIVQAVMAVPTKLLETLAAKINSELFTKFNQLKKVSTTVSKHNPPIKGICRKATVVLEQMR